MSITEDDIRRIIREEIQRALPSPVVPLPLHPGYYPSQYPAPAQPYYPGGPWPVTCATNPEGQFGGFNR